MGKEEVDLACAGKDLSELIDFDRCQFWVEIEAAKLRDEELKVSSCRFRAQEVWVKPHLDKQAISARLVPIELNERVENLTIDESLFLESFQCFSEIEDYTSIPRLPLPVSADVTYQATAKKIICEPEDWSENGKAPEILLVNLLNRQDRVLSIGARHVEISKSFFLFLII